MLYKLKITEIETNKTYKMEVKTDRFEWFMEQFQRNRPALTWEILNN